MSIKNVAVLGSGLIGSSWATLFAKSGYNVKLYDVSKDVLAGVKTRIAANYDKFLKADIMTQEEIDAAMARIYTTASLEEAVSDADFIQECGPEVLSIKQDLIAEIDKYNTEAIIGSSSSALRTTDIQAKSAYPGRVIGAHPFNPPHLMPLVELITGEKTDKKNIRIAYDFYKTNKKEPIVLNKEVVGFVGNRLQAAYTREMIDIVMKGICSVEDVDKASLYGLGLRYAIIGPNLNGDLNGGEGGLRDYYTKYGPGVFEASFKDGMGEWHELPKEFVETVGPEGVRQEKENRPPELGKTREEIIQYRDNFLLALLKLHNKV